ISSKVTEARRCSQTEEAGHYHGQIHRFGWWPGGASGAGTFKIDPTKSPKTADSLQTEGPDKGKTLLGIYEIIDDNHKRACWAPVGKPRPTAFTSEPGRTGQRSYSASLGTGEVAEFP